ncbi:MAG: hypothetical protein K940chlam6_00191 [Chlamydiae bacterium]|nr:hypothetical protein [Chlamydiota bacterium]
MINKIHSHIEVQRSEWHGKKGLTDKIHDFLEKHLPFFTSVFEALFGNGRIEVDRNEYWEAKNIDLKIERKKLTPEQLKSEIERSNCLVKQSKVDGKNFRKERLKKKRNDLNIIKKEIIPLLKVSSAGVSSNIFNRVNALSSEEKQAFQIFQDEKKFSSDNLMTNEELLKFFEQREKELSKEVKELSKEVKELSKEVKELSINVKLHEKLVEKPESKKQNNGGSILPDRTLQMGSLPEEEVEKPIDDLSIIENILSKLDKEGFNINIEKLKNTLPLREKEAFKIFYENAEIDGVSGSKIFVTKEQITSFFKHNKEILKKELEIK